jgi:RHS repeat-associated protein
MDPASTPAFQPWRIDFVYDGLRRLRRMLQYTWNGSAWTSQGEVRYLYDGMLILQERNSGNTPQVNYTRGLDLSGTIEGAGGIGGLLMRSHGYSSGNWSTHNAYHSDANGNVTALMNSAGVLQASYKYNPYGGLISSSGTLAGANTMRFSSKPAIFSATGALGFYYYGYRFYDPGIQRWLNRDPLGERGGLLIFRFLDNDPLRKLDAFGLASRIIPGLVESDYPGSLPVIDMDNWKCYRLPPGPKSRTPPGVDWDAVRLPTGTWWKIGPGELDIGKDGKPKLFQFRHEVWPRDMQIFLDQNWNQWLIEGEIRSRTS